MTPDTLTHPVDWTEELTASQRGRAVVICRRGQAEPVATFQPPAEWADAWSWNITDDGVVFFHRWP